LFSSARNRETLPLARRKPAAAFADHGVELLREVPDELPRIRELAHFAHPVFVRAGMDDREIVADRRVEKVGVLRDDTVSAAHVSAAAIAQIDAAHRDGAVVRIVKTQQQLGERAFSHAGRPDKCHALTDRDAQVDVHEHRLFPVTERQVFYDKVAFWPWFLRLADRIGRLLSVVSRPLRRFKLASAPLCIAEYRKNKRPFLSIEKPIKEHRQKRRETQRCLRAGQACNIALQNIIIGDH
jgi:hypothetical protein